MATTKTRAGENDTPKASPGRRATAQQTGEAGCLTLKLDGKTYVRLSTLRATQRRTHQDIMREAVEQYLDRAGV